MSAKDNPDGPEAMVPWVTTKRLDEVEQKSFLRPAPPEGVEVTPELLEGAVVAHAMELQKALGLPYHEPRVAVEQMGLPWDKVEAVLPYWKQLAATIDPKPGRPKKTVDDRMSHPGSQAVVDSVVKFLVENPGCVRPGPTRQRKVYSGEFREHILGLVGPGGPGEGMTLAQAAHITSIPSNTLAAWLGIKRRKSRRKVK